MRRYIIGSFVLAVVALALYGFTAGQAQRLDAKQLRSMLVQLGYEIKDINTEVGKEKYEVKMNRGGYDVYVAYEISPSTNYVWLTVFLGDFKAATPQEMASNTELTKKYQNVVAMVKENAKIQPTNFYVTESGRLMLGLAIDNRGIDNAMLRSKSEKICADVASSDAVWAK